MKAFTRILIFCSLVALPLFHATAADLELSGFITPDNKSGGGYLHLRITNRGDDEQTVLTENFTTTSRGAWVTTGSGRILIPDVQLSFRIMTMGTTADPEKWKFIPSLPKLCPVTLRKGETATSGIQLDSEFMQAISKLGPAVRIRYMIGENLAKRYGLWHGTIEIKIENTAKTPLAPGKEYQEEKTEK